MKRSSILVGLLAGLATSFCDGALISYEAIDHQYFYSFNVSGITSNPGGRFSNASSSSYIRVTLDTDNLTLAVDEISVQFNDVSLAFTENFTIGLGQSVDLDFTLTARPFGFHVLGGVPVQLTPTTGGNFSAPGFTSASTISFDPIIIDYEIIGPSEIVTGQSATHTFSQSPMSATLNVGGTLNAQGFPDSLILDQIVINAATPSPSGETINESIEGGNIAFSLGFGYFNIDPDLGPFDGNNRITLNRVIPELATTGLTALGLLACLLVRRRSK